MKKVFLLSMVFLYCMGLATGLAADHRVDQKGCKHAGKPTPGITISWSGGCVNGLAEGNGVQILLQKGKEISRYEGKIRAGVREGRGVYAWVNDDRYEGYFQNNRRTGKGIYTWSSGNRYEGDFRDDKRTGKGIMVWADKSPRYNGLYYKSYEGDFLDGRITGQGIAQSSGGVVWEGDFLNGRWLDSKFHQTVSGAAITRHRIEMNAYNFGHDRRKTKYGMLNNKMEIFVAPVFDILHHYQENFAAALIKGKWGFLNPAGDYAIPPSFDFADSFSEGLARACVGDRWGYINPRGNWVIGPEFEFGEKFSEGLAVVRKDRKFGYIRKDGSMAVEPRFDDAESFSEGLAAVRINGLWGFIDPSGKMIIEPTKKIPNNPGHFKSGVVFYSGSPPRIMDRSGQMVIPEKEKNWSNGTWQCIVKEFSADGLASFSQHGDPVTGKKLGFSDIKRGYINTQGRVVIDPVYYSASEFLSGWANVRKNMSTEGAAGYVYIDTKGREGRPKVFWDNLDFDVLAEKRQHYLINPAGEKVLDLTAIVHKQLPRVAGMRMTNPKFRYHGGGVVSYEDDRTNTYGIIADGRWIVPGIDIDQCSYKTFRDELLNAIVLKFDSRKGSLITYNAEGRVEKKTPIERLIPDMAARRLYYESAVTAAKPKGRVLD